MYCTKCAAELHVLGGELTCPRGQMGLSKEMERVLVDRYGPHVASVPREFARAERDGWYCPGCGVLLDAHMICPECGRSLADLKQALVELHPHKRPDGGWR